MAEEWVDHLLDIARKAEAKMGATEKVHMEADKKLNVALAQLAEVEKAQKNAEAALKSFERKSTKALEA